MSRYGVQEHKHHGLTAQRTSCKHIATLLISLGLGDVSGHVAGAFADGAWHFAPWSDWAIWAFVRQGAQVERPNMWFDSLLTHERSQHLSQAVSGIGGRAFRLDATRSAARAILVLAAVSSA